MPHARTRRQWWPALIIIAVGWTLGIDAGSAAAPALMEITPDSSVVWASSGNAGGPFSPTSITYTVINRGTGESLAWCAAKSQPWLSLTPACGTLAPGASAAVTVALVPAVTRELAVDGYSDPISFTNLTNGAFLTAGGSILTGTARRFVTLNVLGSGDSELQGFGAWTRGGSDGAVFRVTTLEDNGDDLAPVPGSLRAAVARRNRHIVFDVAGTIALRTHLWVQADHLTIDGWSAPPPGITITRYGIILRGNRGAHDVVVRGLRVRDITRSPTADTQWDGIQIANGAFNILVHHVSVHGADDGSIDITDSHDVTVAWSLIGPPKSGKNMLVKYHPSRITLHHNLFNSSGLRNPQIENDEARTPATEITVDMRNNLLWRFGAGTLVAKGAWANVVDNYYSKSSGAIRVQTGGRAYTRGNAVHNKSRVNIDKVGLEEAPFPAPPVATTDAATAACQVRQQVGVRPLDALDQAILTKVALKGCPSS
jgi:pectate lyase